MKLIEQTFAVLFSLAFLGRWWSVGISRSNISSRFSSAWTPSLRGLPPSPWPLRSWRP